MLPKRTASTVPIVDDLSSPSGHMSNRARKAAEQRNSLALFGPGGLDAAVAPVVKQPTKAESLRHRAELVRLDARQQGTERRWRNRMDEAARLDAEAAALDGVTT